MHIDSGIDGIIGTPSRDTGSLKPFLPNAVNLHIDSVSGVF